MHWRQTFGKFEEMRRWLNSFIRAPLPAEVFGRGNDVGDVTIELRCYVEASGTEWSERVRRWKLEMATIRLDSAPILACNSVP